MNRKFFLKTLAAMPLIGSAMKVNELNKITTNFDSTERMPVLFLGHGSPMNAIEENEFVAGFREIEKTIPRPNAVLCISAHWETKGTFVTAMQNPKTIHDFGGFSRELFEVQYPAPGSPELAGEVKKLVSKTDIGLDEKWGLDHGAWSVIRHLYPEADVPVIELSLDYYIKPEQHFELARELVSLREKGILIIGSGNMIHNLGMVAWNRLNDDEYGYDWAIEANTRMRQYILDGDHQSLIKFRSQGKAFDLAIPTPEHFLPLLYSLAMKQNKEEIKVFNDKVIAGSLNMMSIKIG